MFVSDRLVFLHLQKAAGTYVVGRLAQALPGEIRGGHAPLRAPKGDRLVVAAIRDPWDRYVSLWSYGCMGQGEVFGRLVRRGLRRILTAAAEWRSRIHDLPGAQAFHGLECLDLRCCHDLHAGRCCGLLPSPWNRRPCSADRTYRREP